MLAAYSAGILLGDGQANLRVVASTDERTEWMELLQLEADEGPCVECFRTGNPVSVTDLTAASTRWPRFMAAVAARGAYGSIHALPLRLRGKPIGTLNLFHQRAGALPAADLALGPGHIAGAAGVLDPLGAVLESEVDGRASRVAEALLADDVGDVPAERTLLPRAMAVVERTAL